MKKENTSAKRVFNLIIDAEDAIPTGSFFDED